MKRNEIHADSNLRMAEKQLFLWLTDNFQKNKEFYITITEIAKGLSVAPGNIYARIASLIQKKYIIKFNHTNTTGRCNSYIILK